MQDMSVKMNPPTQKKGMGEKTRSSGTRSRKPFRLKEWRITLPWVWIAPLGSAVLPEL
jgi:hypothetical protein